MLSKSLIFVSLLSLSSRVLCEDLSEADVPPSCSTICEPIVELTSICDTNPNGQTLKARYVVTPNLDANELSGKHVKLSTRQNSSPGHECVCQNKSFNVAQVAALCASCVQQNKGKTTEINRIVSVCGFPAQKYSPSLDSVAASVDVQATRPTQAFTAAPSSSAKSNPAAAQAAPDMIQMSAPNLSAQGATITQLSVAGYATLESPSATLTESRFTVSLSTMTMAAQSGSSIAAASGASAASVASGAPVASGSDTATAAVTEIGSSATSSATAAQQTKNAAVPMAAGLDTLGLSALVGAVMLAVF